jgi:hypothetical protein
MKNYYAIIPASVRYDKDLTDKAKLLYGEITALTNEKGYCWATNQYFAELYGCHEKSVSRLISQLEKKGYIRTENAKNIFKKIRHIYLIDSNITVTNESISNKNEDIISNKIEDNISNNNVTLISNNNVTPISNKIVTQNNTVINNTNNNNKNNNTIKKLNTKQIAEEFAFLWSAYPNKKGRAKALSSYTKARKNNECTFEEVKNGIEMYTKYIKFHRIDQTKIKHGSTFFNQQCWTDEYAENSFQKRQQLSAFTEIMLNQMDDPDEFLNSLGVDNYEQERKRTIIFASEG